MANNTLFDCGAYWNDSWRKGYRDEKMIYCGIWGKEQEKMKNRVLANWHRFKRLILWKREGRISRMHFVNSWGKLQNRTNKKKWAKPQNEKR
jgi:hypothetical protein